QQTSCGLPVSWCCSKQAMKSLSPAGIPVLLDGVGACIATLGSSHLSIKPGKWSGWVEKAPPHVYIPA
ncbi:hypothetical protein R3M60_20515, partial [Bacillus subtilis]|uniref:hypothetical protein n=1 Tax=Bacillus subtilis TaxID=1423 RepID=UPI0029E7FD8B